MRRKYYHLISLAVILALLAPASAGAVLRRKAPAPGEQTRADWAIERLHQLGAKLIDRRISILNRAIDRVNRADRVAQAERDALVADLSGNITNLSALKETIAANTDIESLKNQIRSIFTDYRIFAVVLPRDRGQLTVGRANAVLARLDNVSAKISKWIEAAKTRGTDVSQIDRLYQDFQAKLADARQQVGTALAGFQAMAPATDITPARNQLDAGKAALRLARDDLKAARQDLRRIIAEIKGLRLGTNK